MIHGYAPSNSGKYSDFAPVATCSAQLQEGLVQLIVVPTADICCETPLDDDPAAFEVTVTFEEVSGKTKVTMRSVFPSAEEVARVKGFGAVEGGQQTLERLAEWLAA